MARSRGGGGLFPEEAVPAAVPDPDERFAEVAVARPVQGHFTYLVPAGLERQVQVGVRVVVPFGRRREIGFVVQTAERTSVPRQKLRALIEVLDDTPVIGGELLEIGRWMASYYACSLGEALGAMLPASLRRGREGRTRRMISVAAGVGEEQLGQIDGVRPKQHRLLRALLELDSPVDAREILRRLNLSSSPMLALERRGWVKVARALAPSEPEPMEAGVERRRPDRLSSEQQSAVQRVEEALDRREVTTFLLRGVTGSGKTEVYLRVIEAALERGLGAIVLVPEIALTPQTVSWFRSRFRDVAVLHSRLTDAQRLTAWRALQRGEVRVVVGARSAVFAPLPRLGVIVVDEEHEPSFKQGSTPRYNARDLAVLRARRAGALCILGSATPALESWRNAREGRYELLELLGRVGGGALPEVEIVDMRGEPAERGPGALFSRALRSALDGALARREQAILFVNRRGFAPVLWCRACGKTLRCGQCDVSMTFHRRIARAVCHSCCEEVALPRECPTCTAPGMRLLGVGAERVQEALRQLWPAARVQRMDSDTMLRREDYEKALAAFARGEIDVLAGTQMIAKGLDFPRVTVVGIVSADANLHLPDFRASERTFQLISQVAGRAGRGDLAGRIIVQTLVPDHPAIALAARHDFPGFARREEELRAEVGYPPSGRLIRVIFEDEDRERARSAAQGVADELRAALAPLDVLVLGPAPAPIERMRGRHRENLLLKAQRDAAGLTRAKILLESLCAGMGRPRIAIDVDPWNML